MKSHNRNNILNLIIIGLTGVILGCSEPQFEKDITTTDSTKDSDLEISLSDPIAVNEIAIEKYAEGKASVIDKKYKAALESFRFSADQGYAPALFEIGQMHEFGMGIKADHLKSISYYKRSSELNNVQAQVVLAKYYETGLFVEVNRTEAIKYYRLAANNGSLEAMRWLIDSSAYDSDLATPFEVFEWQSTLADSGDLSAKYEVGVAFYKGWGTPKDNAAAFEYLKESANLGEPLSNLALANIFMYSSTVNHNAKIALTWLTKDNLPKDPKLILLQGLAHYELFMSEINPREENKQKAMELVDKAVALNEPSSYSYAGNFYLEGIMRKKDPSLAYKHFKVGHELHDPRATFYLGLMSITGEAGAKDLSVGFDLVAKASHMGYPEAIYHEAWMLDNGIGTEKNSPLAQKKYKLSKDLGYTKSLNKLAISLKAELL